MLYVWHRPVPVCPQTGDGAAADAGTGKGETGLQLRWAGWTETVSPTAQCCHMSNVTRESHMWSLIREAETWHLTSWDILWLCRLYSIQLLHCIFCDSRLYSIKLCACIFCAGRWYSMQLFSCKLCASWLYSRGGKSYLQRSSMCMQVFGIIFKSIVQTEVWGLFSQSVV